MGGALTQVETQMEALSLDISRQLNTAQVTAVLVFLRPKTDGTGGLEEIRRYESAFDRIPEAEAEIGDGRSVVIDIADVFPEGQLRADIKAAKYIRLILDGEESPLYSDIDAPEPASNVAQVYRITCMTPTFKQTYIR